MIFVNTGVIANVLGDSLAGGGLKSRANAHILDLICEGEVEGLADGAKGIYLDGTPLQNADGTFNFENVTAEMRPGTNDQTYIAGTPSVESETNVSVEVKKATSVTRTISNSDVNAVRVTLSTPALYKTKDNGDIKGQAVTMAIDVQTNGGGFVTRVTDTIDGKAMNKYQRSYRINLTGTGPWDIRVRRLTEDNTDTKIQNKTFWDTYTEIIDAKLRYPNSALVGLTFDAASFNSIPTRAYDIRMKRVKVPSNYNPTTRAYTGVWDGTFTTAWTDNPAWCFYDLVTNTRYGLGNYIDASQVDKWALYSIAQYCDELVDDGFGGQEPRFTCNIYLQSRAEAYKVVQDMASCFRAITYWASGGMTLSQDAPSDPVALFTQANVADGMFTYSGSSAKARHTVALVTWNDPAFKYEQRVEYVEDQEAIARFGVVPTELTAIGCTSRGQANRVGRWLLYSERYESETVSFTTGIEGAIVRPGNVIKVADASRAGARMGGRVHSATTTDITLDAPVTLGAGTWTLYAALPDGTVGSATVSSVSGSTVTLASALASAPQAGAQWILSSSTLQAQTFRVMTVVEQEGGKVEITALAHDPNKYAAIENGMVLQTRNITILDDVPATPDNGQVSDYLYATLTDVKVGVSISWAQVDRAATYVVNYTVEGGNTISRSVDTNVLEILDAPTGDYVINVYAVTYSGIYSTPLTLTKTILGKGANPADVTGLRLAAQGDNGLLSWDLHPDVDVRIGGRIVVRQSTSTSLTWNTSIPIAEFPGNTNSGVVPLLPGTYMVKALDGLGNLSVGTATITTAAPDIFGFNAVATSTQNPSFSGIKTDMAVSGGWLQLEQSYFFDSIPDLDALTDPIDTGVKSSGSYQFDAPIDTGAVYTSRVSLLIDVLSYSVSNLVDGWASIDTLPDLDGIMDNDLASVTVYISTTNDNPSGASPTWTDWQPFVVGYYTARGYRFKLDVAKGTNPAQQVAIKSLSVVVDVPDRVEAGNTIAVGTGGLAITFSKPFYATPAIAVTAANMATGDYAVITAASRTGFTVTFKNSAGTAVARTMDWIAKGYGYAT